MTRFRSILVATDFSDHATHAVRRGALLAKHHAARLSLLHVVNPSGSRPLRQWFSPSIDVDLKAAQARATLRQFAAEITGRHGLRPRCRVVVGESFDEIRRASEGADLVVLGQRGWNPLKELVIGSTVDRLLRSGRRPTLVVKQPVAGVYRRILVPVDFTSHSEVCLQMAGRLAPKAEVQVFHALASSQEFQLRMAGMPSAAIRDHSDIEDMKWHLRMQSIAAQVGIESGRLGTVVQRGPAWACTLGQADAYGADLIAVAKHGSSAMADFFLGSVTRRLLATAKCNLLVTPPASAERIRTEPVASQTDRPAMRTTREPAAAANTD